MFTRSIRFRLTLWYAGTLAVVLTASGFFWHLYLSRNLLAHLDQRLLIIAQDLGSYHVDRGIEPDQEEECWNIEDFVRRHNWNQYIQFLDRLGRITCYSSNLGPNRLPLGKPALQAAIRSEHFFETIPDFRGQPVRLLSFPVIQKGEVTDVLQVAESLGHKEETLRELRLILVIFSPLALIIVALGGWFLAGQTLAPVVRLSRAMRKIDAENLNQRLPVESTGDEIAVLSTTFNSMLARLEDSFRRIRQFTGDASHELRTPLTILRGETEVALRWAKDPEEFRHMLESNLEEIDRMGRILENLLALAKSEAGEIPLDIQEISLSDLLQDLYLQAKTLGEAKQLDIYLRPEVDEEIHLRGDEVRLRQMFLNLITNAVKYTPPRGRIDLVLRREEDQAVVTVADTGIGIPAEHLPHIFDRFYRIDKARNRQEGGSGLGLAIVKLIVEEHHGRISVRSVPGEGSSFIVRLPLAGPPPGVKKEISG